THGGLALGGLIALFLGSLMLYTPMMPFYRMSLSLIITMVVISAVFFAIIIYICIQALKSKVVIGIKSLIGAEGEVKVKIDPIGIVFVNNEDWTAESV